ncbi:hypothetical protein Pla52o_07840 [Novipirellula galeiformis]|uniref:Uncharacterized protein n=1 Tax=Novipirellula galeiformis TaxID=2528004 RepID=A0A5C6CRD6_9BACT|nr:hypothetical protein [Novipirellula galeiformis]TWU26928.1 hypothetical protein Pla52o_07840 [Novipirellula galeiformis]
MMWILASVFIVGLAVCFCGGSRGDREDLDCSYRVAQPWPIDQLFFGDLVQFESVPLELHDTASVAGIRFSKQPARCDKILAG